MKKLIAVGLVFNIASAFAEPTVDRVVVRQQWPWTPKVKVEYVLKDADAPVDVNVEVFDGETAYPEEAVRNATTGRRHYLTSGVYSIEVDPGVLETGRDSIPGFRVRLTVTAAAPGGDDKLYRIYDIEKGTCTEVSRADLLDGFYGAYETDYGKIGQGFATSLTNVMVWTGVTNYPGAKSTKIVMRRIPAGTFTMGSPASEKSYDRETPQHQVTISKDFWISVFPITRGQVLAIGSPDNASIKQNLAGEDSLFIPENKAPYQKLRGWERDNWPNADFATAHYISHTGCLLYLLRKKFAWNPTFDMLTEAQWEYACRAGTTTAYYSGKTGASTANLSELAYFGKSPDITKLPEVGSFKPNAWGLYDMLGSLWESVIDRYDGTSYSADPVTDPKGLPASSNVGTCCKRGGSFRDNENTCRCSYRSGVAEVTSINENDGMRIGLFEE